MQLIDNQCYKFLHKKRYKCGLSVVNLVSIVHFYQRALYVYLTVRLLILYTGKSINFVFSFLYMYVSSYPSRVASFLCWLEGGGSVGKLHGTQIVFYATADDFFTTPGKLWG